MVRFGPVGREKNDEMKVMHGWWLTGLVWVVGAVFMARVVFLTVLMHGHYQQIAQENRIKREVIPAQRGVLMDRNGKNLVLNQGLSGREIRFYPAGEIVASVVGYVSVTGETMTGATGLEKQYNEILKGVGGERLVEETAQGEVTKEVGVRPAVNGKDLRLNLDLDLQRIVYWALQKGLEASGAKSAAAVVTKVSGEVSALVSLPTFDPNLLTGFGKRGEVGGKYAEVDKVLDDKQNLPLFNRALSGTFEPGSIFKVVPAIAGLSEHLITADTQIEDTGEIKIGESRFGNWYFDQYGRKEGNVDVRKALARSNDIFFYKLGEILGVDKLGEWARKLGMGEKTGVDLPGEAAGLVPSPLWKEKTKNERWFLGNTYHMAIGQGDLLATPMQMNRIGAESVSGLRCEPRLYGVGKCSDLGIGSEYIQTVREGMRAACSPGGTGFTFFDLHGAVWCKTGTAQQGGEKQNPHAWINVVVPRGDDVKQWWVVTVMLQEGGEGSKVAGPVAREIVNFLLK